MSASPRCADRISRTYVAMLTACWFTVLGTETGPAYASDELFPHNERLAAGEAQITREEWLLKVEASKQRAKEAARARREHPELYVTIPADPDVLASERVLADDSLQTGDIVATTQGLFVYRGRQSRSPSEGDFVRIAPPTGP